MWPRRGVWQWLFRNPLRLRFCVGGLALLWGAVAYAGTFVVFGPQDFVRSAGEPTEFIRTFPAAVPGTAYTLHIDNGGSRQQFGRVTSASVKLNGAVIAGPSEFRQSVQTIDKPVTLAAQNTLRIELQGSPGSGFTVTVLGQDSVAPSIAITSPSQPVITGNPTPTVAVTYSDTLSGVDTATLQVAIDSSALAGCTVGPAAANCASPALAGGHHTVTAQVRDRAGNLGTSSFGFDLVLDGEAPVIQFLSPGEGSYVASATPNVIATYSDLGSGVDSASVRLALDGVDRTAEAQVTASGLTFTPVVPLAEGVRIGTLSVRDRSGNEATASVRFTVDTIAPRVMLQLPAEFVGASALAVAGTVEDADPTVQVVINGVPASLSGGTFLISLVLQPGTNEIAAVATDRAGNRGTALGSVCPQKFELWRDDTAIANGIF